MLTNCSIPQTNTLHQLTKVWSRLGHSDGLNYSYSYSGTGLSSRSSQLTGLMLVLVPASHSDSLDQVGEHLLSSGKK